MANTGAPNGYGAQLAGLSPGRERLVPEQAREPVVDTGTWLATPLDPGETARQVLTIAVPHLADAGAVYVLEPLLSGARQPRQDPDRRIVARCLATSVPAGARQDWGDYPPDSEMVVFSPGTPHARCLVTGHPVLFELGAASRCTSLLALPLTAHGEVMGLLLLGRDADGSAYDADDVTRTTALAAQAGICIDNARLFAQERSVAQALQRGLLPRDPPLPVGLDIAHCYRPAGDHMVGGDWYDVIPLPRGRTAIVVGDAMGHGPEAATVMVQLRAAAHVLADLDLAPDALLWRLNRMAVTLTSGTFATCVYAVIDPASGTGTIARAGHLPPVLAPPGGPGDVVDIPPGLPLGLGGDVYGTTSVRLPSGSTLALYSDGLVESRARSFDDGITALRGALATAAGPLQTICDSIVETLCQRGEDDTTLVLARIP